MREEEEEGEGEIEQADEKKDQDRSVTPLDLVGLTFECFDDSTASREEWRETERRGRTYRRDCHLYFVFSFTVSYGFLSNFGAFVRGSY